MRRKVFVFDGDAGAELAQGAVGIGLVFTGAGIVAGIIYLLIKLGVLNIRVMDTGRAIEETDYSAQKPRFVKKAS